jgi:hypothetical protein
MEQTANPFVIVLMFVGRCLVPLIIMLGISYILKRSGLLKEPPEPPDIIEPTEENSMKEMK